MGYTHSWRCQPDSLAYATAWPAVVRDTTEIVNRVSRTVPLAGPDRTGLPLVDENTGIAFNGVGNGGCDSFLLSPPGRQRRHWFFCKTDGLPYDVAVTATLLRCHLLMPGTFAIGGEGSWHRDWRPARDLVEQMFGDEAARTPLSDTTAGLTIEQLLGL